MIPFNPNIHHRRSIRFKDYDYSQAGLYFITICCQNRACLFGEITNGEMILNDAGKIANQYWLDIPNHFPDAILHKHIIMPNHIHGIVELVGAKNFSPDNTMPQNKTPEKTNNNNNGVDDINGAKNFSPENTTPDNTIPQNEIPEKTNNNNGVDDINGAKNFSPLRSPSKTIGSVVRGFKIGVTKWMRQNTDIYNVWQRNYWEHIIKNEKSYQTISEYIINNPKKWNEDKFNTL
jgi:putative transposase